jgi:outer membrane protein, multidrug efflux system
MRRLTNLSLALVVLLAACAGPRADAPDAARVEPPVRWRTDATTADDVDARWWATFGDPRLAALVEEALANNDDIAIAANRVREARGQLRLAGAALLPTVRGSIDGARDRDVSPFGEPELQTASQSQFAIAYDLDLFGRLAATRDAARNALLATEAAHETVRLAVASSTAQAYINLVALDTRLHILQDTLKARAESLDYAQRRTKAGYASQLDVAQAEGEYQATAQQIPPTILAQRRTEDALAVLVGAAPRAADRIDALETLAIPTVPSLLPSRLLRRRPDLAQAEYQVVAADRSLDAARAAFMPDIQLGASGGLVTSTLLEGPIRIFTLGGSILVPLFEGGRLEAGAEIATARRDEAAFAYRRAALNAFREVEDAMASVQQSGAQEDAARRQRDAAARTLAIADDRYKTGYSPYLEQLDAQRGLLTAELAVAQVRTDRLTAAVTLYQTLGGGWSADAPRDSRAAR